MPSVSGPPRPPGAGTAIAFRGRQPMQLRRVVCRSGRSWCVLSIVLLLGAGEARAQTPAPDPQPATQPAPPGPPPQIELNLINLPTTLSIRRHHSYFRLTHRFARDLLRGSFGQLAEDLFSLDSGAIIGLEYRFGLTDRLQAGVHRTILSKTIETFARWDAIRQGDRSRVSLSGTLSLEGLNNMQEKRQPALAITASHTFGNIAAVYVTPAFVGRTRAVDFIAGHDEDHGVGGAIDEHNHHKDTWLTGFGARLRVRPTAFVVGEYTARLHGYDPNANVWGVAIEKYTGGHTLQLNFTNSFA